MIKKRIIPFVGEEPILTPDAGFVPNNNSVPQGSNPFSGVTIDQSGAPVALPKILPQETPVSSVYPVAPVQEAPVQPAAVYPVPRSASTQAEINAIRDKDYSKAVIDEQGNVVKPAGANRDKQWSTLEKIGNAAMGFLVGVGQGGLGGGIVEGVRGATDRNYNEKLADKKQLAQLYPQMKQEQEQEANQARTDNIYTDNRYQTERLEESRAERQRKIDDRKSREQTNRMNQVAGMFKNIPEFLPGDPRFADIEKALGDVNLPITPKDAKKKVDLKQDQRTGEWTVILTNPLDGKQEVRPVMKDGQPYKSTPTVIMQGEYGMLRQNDQQTFTAEENEKNRQLSLQKQQLGFQMQAQLKAIEAANSAAAKATDQKARAEYQQKAIEAQKEYIRLRAEAKQLEQ